MHCIWKYEEFHSYRNISVATDFLLFYFKEHIDGKKLNKPRQRDEHSNQGQRWHLQLNFLNSTFLCVTKL